MATQLVDVKLEEISLVDNPANPGAYILLTKAQKPSMCKMDGAMPCDGSCEDCPNPVAKAAMKTEGGVQYPAAAYAYVPDAESPSTWKLRLWDETKKPSARIIGAAIAALGPGYRGNKVEIPSGDLPGVKAKVRAAWKQVHDSSEVMPAILKGAEMTVEEQVAKLQTDQEALLARLERSEKINKLSPEERSIFDGFSPEDQGKYLSGDEPTMKRLTDEVAKRKNEPSPDVESLRKAKDELQKRVEATEQMLKSERDRRELVEFEKRAESEYGFLPGTSSEKAKVLKSISDNFPKDDQESLFKLLKAGNHAMQTLMAAPGGNPRIEGTISAQIDSLAKAKAKEKGVSFAKAKAMVFDEQPSLYKQWQDEEFYARKGN